MATAEDKSRPSCSVFDDFEHLSLSPELASECREAFDSRGGVSGLAKFLHDKADEWKAIPIDIGVIGNSGSGKSSFINAIRGIFYADDPGAAAIDVKEGTKEPTAYSHPRNKSFRLWDLPGVGTLEFPKESYLQKIELDKKDFLIVMSSERFKENDAWLGSQIAAAGKRFYFVRTKVDQDVANEMRARRVKPSEESVLQKIRSNMITNLKAIRCPDTPLFLIDNYDNSRFDFGKLEQSLVKDCPKIKREALLFSLRIMSDAVLDAKVVALRSRAHYASIVSGLIAVIPVPGLSVVADLGILAEEIEFAFRQLGLDAESLRHTATLTNSNFDELQKVVDDSSVGIFGAQLSRQAIEAALKQAAKKAPVYVAASITEEFSRYFPFLGPVIAGSLSYGTNYLLLKKFLDDMHQVATKILKIALKKTADDIVATMAFSQ